MWARRTSAMAANTLVSQAFLRRGVQQFEFLHSVNINNKLCSFRAFPLTTAFDSRGGEDFSISEIGTVLLVCVMQKADNYQQIGNIYGTKLLESLFKFGMNDCHSHGILLFVHCANAAIQTFGLCHLAQAVKDDADVSLKGVADKDMIEDVKRIVEMADRALSRRVVLHTDFLTPPVLKESMLVLQKFVDFKMVAQGGYPEAERCRLSVGHPEMLTSDPDIVAALSISGNFGFESCNHGDFLGAILGTGIVRDKLGDIILQGEKGAHILVVPELVDFLTSSLDKVRNVSVACKKIPLLALEYEPPRTKSLKTVEASLRLDAVASAGFKISRSKMASLIGNGDVRVNWTTVMKNNTTVKTGDIISVSGQGRLKIGEINSTRKGKFAIELIRYL